MDTLTELIEYIVAHNNLGGEDVDIFRHILPGDKVECIAVIPYAASPTPIFTETSSKHFQILVQRKSRKAAYDMALKIYKSLRTSDTAFIELKTMLCPIGLGGIPQELSTEDTKKKNVVRYIFDISILSLN